MAMSPEFQSFIDEIIDKNDIVDVISMYAKLKRSGRTYRGLCPIHNDRKNPSLSVDPQNRLFKCFGCGAGGTVIQFIMAKENLDFMEAVKLLADRAGVAMPERQSYADARRGAERQDKKKRMREMHREAARFFFENLCDRKNIAALDYLRKRNISNETIKSFGLGYSPEKSVLGDYLKEKGFPLSLTEEAGLIIKGKNGYYDKFRGRVMFPIFDVRGNVIAFGGRIIVNNDKAPKYLNSNGSLIFNKSENLFAFNRAKDSNNDELLLMEGYMDVISLHQAGFTNAVASLGTAFTPEQARLIKRYKRRAVLCYDSDEAGQKATDRAGKILMDADIAAKVLTVTGAKDPDEYINKMGGEKFSLLISSAENFIEYKIRKTAEKYDFDDVDRKLEFIMEASRILSDIKDETKRDVFVRDIARKVDIAPERFSAQIDRIKKIGAGAESRGVLRDEMRLMEARRGGRGKTPQQRRLFEAERLILNLICSKEIYERVKNEISPEDFSEEIHKKLCGKIYETYNRGESVEPTRIVAEFPPEDIPAVSGILTDDKNVERTADALLMPISIMKENLQKQKFKKIDQNNDSELLEYFSMLRTKKQ